MRIICASAILTAMLAGCASSNAQDMSGESISALLADGQSMKLGGPNEGYTGSVLLKADGTGVGSAVLDSGKKLDISGTWRVQGDRFCRKWKFNDYEEVCETWRKIGANSVEVLVNGKKVGVNSW